MVSTTSSAGISDVPEGSRKCDGVELRAKTHRCFTAVGCHPQTPSENQESQETETHCSTACCETAGKGKISA